MWSYFYFNNYGREQLNFYHSKQREKKQYLQNGNLKLSSDWNKVLTAEHGSMGCPIITQYWLQTSGVELTNLNFDGKHTGYIAALIFHFPKKSVQILLHPPLPSSCLQSYSSKPNPDVLLSKDGGDEYSIVRVLMKPILPLSWADLLVRSNQLNTSVFA